MSDTGRLIASKTFQLGASCDWQCHGWCPAHSRWGSSTVNDGNAYVAVLNDNDGRRILDDNWFDNEWHSDYRFLLSQSVPWLTAVAFGRRLFCLQLPLPAANHFSYFTQRGDECGVLLMVETAQFPSDLGEKLEEIEFGTGVLHAMELFGAGRIAGKQNACNKVRKQRVNFRTERKFGEPWKTCVISVPQFVGDERFFKHGQV